ncbi:hypothetical protein EVAR_84843_1 [Eumeta japonica]|uniref:Uncharacterized protein n=1 Tax=Eumeta variegata TaxID=151549 RepID=A0A4C1U855_EUMVA|nr:hypothetical protein EVAR_84843_1 [Eumeta japonica]
MSFQSNWFPSTSLPTTDIECIPSSFIWKNFADDPNLVPAFNSGSGIILDFDLDQVLDYNFDPILGFNSVLSRIVSFGRGPGSHSTLRPDFNSDTALTSTGSHGVHKEEYEKHEKRAAPRAGRCLEMSVRGTSERGNFQFGCAGGPSE